MDKIECGVLKAGKYTHSNFWDNDTKIDGVFIDVYVTIPGKKEITNKEKVKYKNMFETAPELLELAENVAEYFDKYDVSIWNAEPNEKHPMQKKAEKAIKKAKGELDD